MRVVPGQAAHQLTELRGHKTSHEAMLLYDRPACLYDVVMTAVRAKVTRNGQVSLPAELRHRWDASAVLVIDRGDYAIVRPIPEDVVAALQGSHGGPGPTSESARQTERAAETASESRHAER